MFPCHEFGDSTCDPINQLYYRKHHMDWIIQVYEITVKDNNEV